MSLLKSHRLRVTALLLLLPLLSYSQAEKKYIRQGNREYGKEKFRESEILYRKAADKNNGSADAVFNIGNALYKQNKHEDAARQFSGSFEMNDDKKKKSAGLYNLGNSLLMANKIPESIEAYKGSLKLDPDNMEAKYNLAYAQDLLNQQQQQQNQDQNRDQENKDNKDQQQDQKGEQDQQQQDKQKQEQEQQQQNGAAREQEISREDAERILNSLANDEKEVQEKVKLAKARQQKVKTLRNW